MLSWDAFTYKTTGFIIYQLKILVDISNTKNITNVPTQNILFLDFSLKNIII